MLQVFEALIKRIKEFIDSKLTGTIALNFNQGKVQSWHVTVHGREPDEKNELTTKQET